MSTGGGMLAGKKGFCFMFTLMKQTDNADVMMLIFDFGIRKIV